MKIHKDYGFIGNEDGGDSDRGALLDFTPDVNEATPSKNTKWSHKKIPNIKLESFEDVVIQYSAANLKWKEENYDLKSKIQNLSHVEKELQKARDEFKELKGAFLASQRQRKATESQCRELIDRLETSIRQHKDVQSKYQDQQSKTVDLEGTILKLQNSALNIENEKQKIQKNYKGLMERFFENQTELMALNRAFDANRDQILQLESQYAKHQAQSERDTNLVQSNIKLNQRLSDGLEGLKRNLADTESKNTQLANSKRLLEQENSELRKGIEALKGKTFQLESYRFTADKTIHQIRSAKSKLEETLTTRMSSLSSAQKQELNNLKQNFLDLKGLNSELKNRLKSNEEGHEAQLRLLKETHRTEARELSRVLSEWKTRYQELEKKFLDKTQENAQTLLELQSLEMSSHRQSEVVDGQTKEIFKLKEVLGESERQATEFRTKYKDTNSRLSVVEKAFAQKSSENSDNVLKIENLEAALQKHQEILGCKNKALSDLEVTVQNISQQSVEIQQKHTVSFGRMEALESAFEQKSKENRRNIHKIKELEDVNLKLQHALEDRDKSLGEFEETLRALDSKNNEVKILEGYKLSVEARDEERAKSAKSLKKQQQSLAEELRALESLKHEFELASQALQNQKSLLASERKNLDVEKRDVDRKWNEISKAEKKLNTGSEDLERKRSDLDPILKEATRLETLKAQLDSQERAFRERQTHFANYVGMVNKTKAELRGQVKKLSYELKMSMGLNPLQEYLSLTEREIDRLDLQLRKTPTLSAERNRLEAYLDELFEQRVFLRENIRKSKIEAEKRGAELEEVLNSPALSAAVPPLPPHARKESL